MLTKQHFAELSNIGFKLFALAAFPVAKEPLRTGWIIKIEHRRLNKSVRGACAGWVQRIAFQLDRAPIHSRGDKRNGARAPRHRGRVVEEFPGNRPLHVFCERNQMHLRLATTR